METNLELAQLDANKSSHKLINLQKQELAIESKILQEIKVLKNSNSLDPQLANAIRNDIKHLTDSFKLYAVKSYEQLQEINGNIKRGLTNINSSLLIINKSILESNAKLINQLSIFQNELVEVLANPDKNASREKRIKAREQIQRAFLNEKYRAENLSEGIRLYELALNHEVGMYDSLGWLELAYAYSYTGKVQNALNAFMKADQYSEIGNQTNFSIKNEALINIAQLHISQKDFKSAHFAINESVNTKKYSDYTLLILKGIVEVKLGYTKEGINQMIIGLNQRPDLIRIIYLYMDEGILSEDFVSSFVKQIIDLKRNKFFITYKNIQSKLKGFEYVWNTYRTHHFSKIVERIDKIMNSYKQLGESSFLEVHGMSQEMLELKEGLNKEIDSILRNQVETLKQNISKKETSINTLVSNQEREERNITNQALRNDSNFESNFGEKSFFAGVVISILSLIFLDFIISGWFFRLIATIAAVIIGSKVVKNYMYEQSDQEINRKIGQHREQKNREQKKLEEAKRSFTNERIKLKKFIKK